MITGPSNSTKVISKNRSGIDSLESIKMGRFNTLANEEDAISLASFQYPIDSEDQEEVKDDHKE